MASPTPSSQNNQGPPPNKLSPLQIINELFQSEVWQYLCDHTSDDTNMILLCDFPSKISKPSFHCQIYGLDDFQYFLQATSLNAEHDIVVSTQHSATLKRILQFKNPHVPPFRFFTRSSSALPFELKLIEILNILPEQSFKKTESLQFIKSFFVGLHNRKAPYNKSFDLFLLSLNSDSFCHSLLLSSPEFAIHGLFFTENSELLSQASSILSSHAIEHTFSNPLQAKLPKDFDEISYSFPVTSDMQITPIISLLNSISFVDSFYFIAMVSADHSLASSSDINFIKTNRIDCIPLIELFQLHSFKYMNTQNFLLYLATPL